MKKNMNPKWLNRRVPGKSTSLLGLIIAAPKPILASPLLWFIIPFFLIATVAAPLALILNKVITIPDSTPTPYTGLPVPPNKDVEKNTNQFSFDLNGWQPNSDPQHFYGVNRPTSAYGQNFDSKKLFLPASGSTDRMPLFNAKTGEQVSSEFFSYSFDKEKYLKCSENLLNTLLSRILLDQDDPNRIVVPKGYSIRRLYERIKNTYCTFYRTSRNSLIDEFKSPYVENVRYNVFSSKGEIMVKSPDSVYKKRDMWFEHDVQTLGEVSWEFDFPAVFPEAYRSRYKVPLNGSIKGDNLHTQDRLATTITRDTRTTLNTELFYRYFLNSPYRDIKYLYERIPRRKIQADDIIPRTLVRPGMGPKNTWAQSVYRDYRGDTAFRLSHKEVNLTIEQPGTVEKLIAIPNNWDNTKQLNYMWSSDFATANTAVSSLLSTFEHANVLNYKLRYNEVINIDDYAKYFLRATFDNARNILVNKKFEETANNTTYDTNKMFIHDAYLTGPMRGLGTFTYESPSVTRNLANLQNPDQTAFEYDMFEETIRSSECSGNKANSFIQAVCPTVKKTLQATDGSSATVYVPANANEATEYFAELAEINDLWDFLYVELNKILQQKKYKNAPFIPYDNDRRNRLGRFLDQILNKEKDAKFKKENFSLFDAFLELFRSRKVIARLQLHRQTPEAIKNQLNNLRENAVTSLMELTSLKDVNSPVISYADWETRMKNAIGKIQEVINFYAKSEADRKLDTQYTITATNSKQKTFKYTVPGRNLTYHLYVRYMKMHEAKVKYSFDENGKAIEFKIWKWKYPSNNPVTERMVKVKDATDSELAFFVIHYLKDTRFPWIPLRFGRSIVAVNPGKVNDLYLSNYSPKYDAMVQDAENMINSYMSSLMFQENKLGFGTAPPRASDESGVFKWIDFDVVETKEQAGRELAIYKEGNLSDGSGYDKGNFFNGMTDTVVLLKDFMSYTLHYLASPNKLNLAPSNDPKPLFADTKKVQHCLVTYESVGPKKSLGFENVILPKDKRKPDTEPPSNKLLDYFQIGNPSSFSRVDSIQVPRANSGIFTQSKAYFREAEITSPELVSKYLYAHFSKCFSNEQYKKPLDPNNKDYDPNADEWRPVLKEVPLRIHWDLLDIA